MLATLRILAAASLCASSCYWLGSLLLLPVADRLYRTERAALAYVLGSAAFSLLVFATGTLWTVHPALYLALAAILGGGWAKFRRRSITRSLPQREPLPWTWIAALGVAFSAFGAYYLVNALAPEISPDGASYHLSLVARYVREHRIVATPTNFYSGLSQGIEMLFLAAYVFGGTSAAALMHLSFLPVLATLMLSLGRRYGMPHVGALAALVAFVTPVVGIDASSAYNDVALACAAFACFYLLLLWEQEALPLLAFFAGCLAGFCYAVKYSGFGAMPFGVFYIAFTFQGRRLSRPLLLALGLFTAGGLLLSVPWLLKNALWYGNPLAPLYNDIFPNNFVHIDFEQRYRESLRNWGNLPSKWLIPIELTVRGFALQGIIGPLFFLAPLALLALRSPLGRRMNAFIVFLALPYAMNIGTRFLIPTLPFLAFAMLLPITRHKRAMAAVALAHSLLSWPLVVSLYCHPNAWRLVTFPLRAAIHREPAEAFLARTLYEWPMTEYIRSNLPKTATVFALSGFSDAYTNRDVWAAEHSATGERLRYALWSAHFPEYQPKEWIDLTIPVTKARKMRVNYAGPDSEEGWGVSELIVRGPAGEILRDSKWRITAHPNSFGVGEAFDNNPVTSWMTWQKATKGMYVELDFGAEVQVQSVSMQTSGHYSQVQLGVDILNERGWSRLSTASRRTTEREDPRWRLAATAALQRAGISHILIPPGNYLDFDVSANPESWGVTKEYSARGWKLFKIQR